MPCLTSENKCSHMCLRSANNTHVCSCPTGMKLQNATNCIRAKKDSEILYLESREGIIKTARFYENQFGVKVANLTEPQNYTAPPVGLDYDEITGNIYWSDRNRVCIRF